DRRWQNVLAIVAPAGFVSFIPPLVRAGPEAYKGMLIEAFVIPTIIVLLASASWSKVWRAVLRVIGAGGPATDPQRTYDHG
ncbi:MAG TPA: hypothetical protein VFG71_07395, partial [Nitrospiraceae bacterium]|nr:hypothetical protein [Nitrospiraceae bacterium]